MFVLVSGDGGDVRATVRDQQNLKQLHAEFRGAGDDAADEALRAAGWAAWTATTCGSTPPRCARRATAAPAGTPSSTEC